MMGSSMSYFDFSQVDWGAMWGATWETVWVTLVSVLFSAIFGYLIGLVLFETKDSSNPTFKAINWVVGLLVNIFRSLPYIILLVLLIPFTNFVFRTITGPIAALPSLIFSASPFFARIVEMSFREIDQGVLEAAESMGASRWIIIFKVLLPESLPALVSGLTVTAISLVGYTAMAGAIGAGGLGALAYNSGFQQYNGTVLLVASVLIVLFVFIIQWTGDLIVKKIDKRVV
ncbi:methionine import system permease protein metI [Pediococcus claussenii ATCC BAA-344]|uniref:Methionine import system permease protein metI n=2 Tax=Pediococcus claussenii TaxID=187452 RepID=G8PCI1_PEDCP|nr:methionine ABC transporter permease [Pediococcus claussenii]AEV94966.1 methionine import system permease protein metI [Pediococcus claussenii ATCC BAA-344]ANZ70155.1 methionine ABC transporter permease [Pediococcus claussenii]ANZ71971.1 methionine ABC transporter permease [Pediococcus claussenii]